MSRILVTGASGFIGSALVSFLRSNGSEVIELSRKEGPNKIVWDIPKRSYNLDDFEGFDAVIHLAGEPLTLTRWTKAKKDKILQSRVLGTEILTEIFSKVSRAPKLFLSASAFGFYGDRGDTLLTEESSLGDGFLAGVCSLWEQASMPLEKLGIRVVHARFGVVLGANGGPLSKIIPAYKWGLGGKLGRGEQWMSWIYLGDLISALNHISKDDSLIGPVNVTSPNPVKQKDFCHVLSEILHRPCLFSLPAPLIRMVLGEAGSELLLYSGRVYPAKLLATNFHFNYPDLRSALLHIILQENI